MAKASNEERVLRGRLARIRRNIRECQTKRVEYERAGLSTETLDAEIAQLQAREQTTKEAIEVWR